MTLSRQEMFNTVSEHLLTQGEKAFDVAGTCVYRGAKGMSCAVGCLIPDSLYEPLMDGRSPEDTVEDEANSMSIENLFEASPKVAELLGAGNRAFLVLLQSIHDCYEVEEWKEELEKLAADLSLSMPNAP